MTLNHLRDNLAHDAGKEHLCHYQDQYDNLFYLCKVRRLTCISSDRPVVQQSLLPVQGTLSHLVAWWLSGRALDLRFTDRGFNSRPVGFHVT